MNIFNIKKYNNYIDLTKYIKVLDYMLVTI